MAMTGQDWLNYFQSLNQPKRKADWLDTATGLAGAAGGFMLGGPAGAMAGYGLGKSVGNVGENAVNHTLNAGNVTADAMGAIPGVQQLGALSQQQELMKFLMANPGVLHMAGGGMAMAPPPDVLAAIQQAMAQKPQQPDATDPFAGATPQSMAGPPPTPTPPAQASHPGWEAASAILGDVLAKLPAPRQTRSSNKTIGAYLPALGAAISGPGEYAAKQRAAKNAPIQKANDAAAEDYRTSVRNAASFLATHRGQMARDNAIRAFEKPYKDAAMTNANDANKRADVLAGVTQASASETARHNRVMEQAAALKAANDAKAAGATDWMHYLVRTTARGQKYLDMSNLSPKEMRAAQEFGFANGAYPANKQVVDKLSRLEDARANISDMVAQAETFLPNTLDPSRRAAAAARNTIADLTQMNPTISSWKTWRISAIQQLVALAGGMGSGLRVNQAEIKQAVENDIPRITDNLPTAQQKAENIRNLLNNAEDSLLGGNSTPVRVEIGKDGKAHFVVADALPNSLKPAPAHADTSGKWGW